MKPFYWKSHYGNFGDELNRWLWDFLLPGFRDAHPDVLLVGVGTILNRHELPEAGRKLVVGSGFGYGEVPDLSDPAAWDLRCVRGPLTAERLGLEPRLAAIDPAVMVSEMPEFQNLPKTDDAIFVPHWRSAVNGAWELAAEAAGLTCISPCGNDKAVIKAIAQARLVVAESMHAAIVADAFRVPWIAVSTSTNINGFKWRDWTASVGLTYDPRPVPLSAPAEARAKGVAFWGVPLPAKAPRPVHFGVVAADGTITLERPLLQASAPRMFAKRLLAVPAVLGLRQACRAAPQLSADGALAARKAQLSDILADIRRDYL